MATESQRIAFIQEIAPCAQEGYRKLGKVLPSVCIGMACVESAYGTSSIMRKHNAFFGQKVGTGKTATKYWGGKFFTSKTKEEYTIGTHTVITSAFRAYDSMQQCVYNFYELLNTSLYKKVQAGVPYQTQMQQIKACGYMTSSTEVNSVITLIQKYGLTKYDDAPLEEILPQITHPTLKKGSRGDIVKAVQIFLNLNGYNCGSADSIFGAKTEAAVKAWQKANGLVPDGIIGKNSWRVLENQLS